MPHQAARDQTPSSTVLASCVHVLDRPISDCSFDADLRSLYDPTTKAIVLHESQSSGSDDNNEYHVSQSGRPDFGHAAPARSTLSTTALSIHHQLDGVEQSSTLRCRAVVNPAVSIASSANLTVNRRLPSAVVDFDEPTPTAPSKTPASTTSMTASLTKDFRRNCISEPCRNCTSDPRCNCTGDFCRATTTTLTATTAPWTSTHG
ncbi:hypothetical protein EV715DRAFT_298202 [Schizophyllum commune]